MQRYILDSMIGKGTLLETVRPWQVVKLQQNSLGRLATVGTPEEGDEQRSTWHGVFMELKLQESSHCALHCGLSRAWNTAGPEQIRFGGKGLSLETRLEGEGTG